MLFLQSVFKTLRLSCLRIGIGWMFALLTLNFNRVTIVELGGVAFVVATLIGLHHFLAPFQVVWGRMADRYPLFGYRRTPYLILGAFVGSLVFLALPTVALALGARSLEAAMLAVGLFMLFGLAMAANGSSTFALITEVTNERERGVVVAVTQTFLIISAIVSAQIAKEIMPVYSAAQMQELYNLTPFIVMGSTLLGVVGLERRITRAEHLALRAQSQAPIATRGSPGTLMIAVQLLRSNRQVRGFFLFLLLAIMGIFLQDAILEVFGAEVFAMLPHETSSFTQIWGGGVLLGMLLLGIVTTMLSISRKLLATVGGLATALSLGMVAAAALAQTAEMLPSALLLMGFSTGIFNVGALAMMLEMTVDGQTGFYMGLWGMAQGFGTGLANSLSGGLHTALIETELLTPSHAYGLIFSLEGLCMVGAVLVLRGISTQEFHGLGQADLTRALATEAAT